MYNSDDDDVSDDDHQINILKQSMENRKLDDLIDYCRMHHNIHIKKDIGTHCDYPRDAFCILICTYGQDKCILRINRVESIDMDKLRFELETMFGHHLFMQKLTVLMTGSLRFIYDTHWGTPSLIGCNHDFNPNSGISVRVQSADISQDIEFTMDSYDGNGYFKIRGYDPIIVRQNPEHIENDVKFLIAELIRISLKTQEDYKSLDSILKTEWINQEISYRNCIIHYSNGDYRLTYNLLIVYCSNFDEVINNLVKWGLYTTGSRTKVASHA